MTILKVSLHQLRDEERGMLLYCCQCNDLAHYWCNGIPFCVTHWVPDPVLEAAKRERNQERKEQA